MSTFRSKIAHLFATHSRKGNCASAPFFLDCAVRDAKALLANLDRAERDCAGIVDSRTRATAEAFVRHLEANAKESWERANRLQDGIEGEATGVAWKAG